MLTLLVEVALFTVSKPYHALRVNLDDLATTVAVRLVLLTLPDFVAAGLADSQDFASELYAITSVITC